MQGGRWRRARQQGFGNGAERAWAGARPLGALARPAGRLAGLQRGRAGCAQGAGSGAAVEREKSERRRERERELGECNTPISTKFRCYPLSFLLLFFFFLNSGVFYFVLYM
jgi:hypothetical protein